MALVAPVQDVGADAGVVGVVGAYCCRPRSAPFEALELEAFRLTCELIAEKLTHQQGGVSTPATPATPATLATLAAPVANHAMGVEEAAAPLESFTDIVTNNMLEMISVHDFSPEGAYIYVSPTCRTLLGYAPEDMVGKPAHYFFHPDDLTDLKSIHDDVLGAKEHDPAAYRIGDQLRLRKADGSYLWTVTSTKSTPRGFVCVTRDDTYFHKLQCALRDNLRKYEMLMALSPDMVTLHAASDTLMPITYASKASESILGWSPNELVGRSHYDLCHWADVAAVQERHDKILEEHRAGIGGSTVTSFHTCRMRRKDGSYAFVEVSSMWSFLPPGTVVKITRDVTELKALEAERALALERHELLARHTADIISLHAPSEHFEFLYMSPSVRIMLGYREAELLGTSLYELVHEDDLIAWHLVMRGINGSKIGSNLATRGDISAREESPTVDGFSAVQRQPSAGGAHAAAGSTGGPEMDGEPAAAATALRMARATAPLREVAMPTTALTPATAPTTMDYRLRRKDGSWVWVETVLKAAGSRGYVCVTREITQRKEADMNTKQVMHDLCTSHEARLSTLLSVAFECILLVTSEATTLHLSTTAQQIIGLERLLPPHKAAAPIANAIPPADIDHLHNALAAARALYTTSEDSSAPLHDDDALDAAPSFA